MDHNHLISYIVFVFLWMVSPGPCFALVARNSVKYGFKAGFWTALGMVLCDSIFIFFAVIGVAEFLSMFPKVLNAGKMIGSAYIFYIGVDIFLTTFRKNKEDFTCGDLKATENQPFTLFRRGFLTDAANPLLIIGMLAIVLSFIDLKGGTGHITLYSVIIPVMTAFVNIMVAICFGNKIIRSVITPFIKWFERFAGVVISLLAISMLIS
jgi:threonine/homoserine/homoserine lactone efflux protein